MQKLREDLPELPDEKRTLCYTHGLIGHDDQDRGGKTTNEFFEEVAKGHDPKMAANWVTGELFVL